jgi:hypothetical protein
MPLEGKRVATEENHCPFQTILDLDNSYLYMSTLTESDSHTIKLSKRCVSCWARHRLTVVLATRQLFASAEDQQSTCAKNGCFQTRWFGTRYCYRHANDEVGTNWHSMPRYDPAQISSEFRGRQSHFMSATSKQWTSSQDIQLAMSRAAEIRAGHRQGTDLVILDVEFSRSGQVKEVALIEYVSGRVLLNTLVKLQAPPELSQLKLAWRRGLIDQLWSRKLDSSGTNTDQYLDVCAIAEALEDSGVTKDSVILVWHSTYYDLTLLDNFLESAGANSPLPSRANCVRLVPHVRANVPPHNGKPFPATLSTIFPILFPRHELVGRNHRALVDCQQTRLVMTAFEEFAKPIGSPGRLEFSDIKPTQQTLDNWLVDPTLVSHHQETVTP